MADNHIQFRIGSTFSGEGFTKANNAVKSVSGTVRKATGDLKGITDALGSAGGAFGKTANMVGKFAGAIAHGGILGVAMAGATVAIEKLVGWYSEWKKVAADAALAARGLSREFMSLEAMQAGYNKRVAAWKKCAEEAKKEEADSKKAAKEAAEAKRKGLADAWAMADKYYATLTAIEQEEIKAAAAGKEGNDALQARIRLMALAANAEVAKARRGVDAAKETGGDVFMAEKALQLALKKRETAKAEAKALLEAEEKKKEAAKAEADQKFIDALREDKLKEESEKRRLAAEKAIQKIREDGEKKSKEIDDQIVSARKEAARLEENAARARGVSFGDWMRGERDRARDDRTAKGMATKRMASVDREIDRLSNMNPKLMTKGQKERLAKLLEWKADQDPKNNPAQKKVDELQKEKDKLLKDQKDLLASIDKKLKDIGI